MATVRQIEANRRNAQMSTGPKTPEGKAASRMNALRHGLRARTAVLPGENQEDFDQLCDDLESEWQPQTRSELFYLEQMAISQWKLTRTEIAEQSVFAQITDPEKQIPMLDRIWQCQSRFERSYASGQRELKRLQGSRTPPPGPTPEEEHNRRFHTLFAKAHMAKAGLPFDLDDSDTDHNNIDRSNKHQPAAPTQVALADPGGVYR